MDSNDQAVRTGEDPTKAVLSESGLHEKHLCDYVINVATGCRHGCKFCYVPSTPNIRTRPDMLKEEAEVEDPQREWGRYVLYRDDLPGRLEGILDRKQKWRTTKFGRGIVGISFATDCYMDGRAGAITREVVRILSNHDRYARVLTRNPILALQDVDVFEEAGDFVTIGSSIPTLNANEIAAIEPSAPAPSHRLRGLKKFNELGINTFVSMSPTYPTQDRDELRSTLLAIKECDPDIVFHEPINPRGANFEMTVNAAREAGEERLAKSLDALRDREQWFNYSITHFRHVQEIAVDLDLDVHLWPDSRHLKLASGKVHDWLKNWKDRQSLEEFGNRPEPTSPLPPYPRSTTPYLSEVA